MLHKIQLSVKTLGADISGVIFPEFFIQVKQNPIEMNLPRGIFDEFALGNSVLPR